MAAQKGASMLLKVGDGASPESFTTIAGLRSTSITLNDEAVDITNKDSSGNRELLADGGIHSMSISGSGVFRDQASEETLRSKMNATSFSNFQLKPFHFFKFFDPQQTPFIGTGIEQCSANTNIRSCRTTS